MRTPVLLPGARCAPGAVRPTGSGLRTGPSCPVTADRPRPPSRGPNTGRPSDYSCCFFALRFCTS